MGEDDDYETDFLPEEFGITSQMTSAGRAVLDSWLSFWEMREVDFRADELVQKIFVAMMTKDARERPD